MCVLVCVVGHLEHQSTHAEDHAEQVHVVRRGVLQCGVALCAGRLVPANTTNTERNSISLFRQDQLFHHKTTWTFIYSDVLLFSLSSISDVGR